MNLRKFDPQRVFRRVYSRFFGPYDYSSHIFVLHELKAIYMAVPKVANTSVKAVLSSHLAGALGEEEQRGQANRGVYRNHRNTLFKQKARLLKHEVPRYEDYFVFAFVRNPWDRLVSCYKDKVLTGSELEGGRFKRPGVGAGQAGGGAAHRGSGGRGSSALGRRFPVGMDFDDFVAEVARTPDRRANRHFRSQYTFLTDRTGALLPDFVGRYESLSEDFSHVMEKIGAGEIALPHIRKSSSSSYRDFYTPSLAELVSARFRDDIELFDYSF